MASARSRLPRKPANQYHHGDLRRALLEAAVRTIQKRGVEGLTLRAVGHELGVSRSALYRHFADKAALLAAVAHEGFRTLRIELEAAWQGAGQGLLGFTTMGEAYVRFAIAQPAHYRVMFGCGFDRSAAAPELLEEGARAFAVLVNAITQQRPGMLQPDDPERLAHFIWALVHGIALLAIDGALREGTDVEALTRYAIERMRTGIAAHGDRNEAAPQGLIS